MTKDRITQAAVAQSRAATSKALGRWNVLEIKIGRGEVTPSDAARSFNSISRELVASLRKIDSRLP